MRLLLWDFNERSYKFYIEVSTNMKNWTVVFDKRQLAVKSWQSFYFPGRLVSYIRLLGTECIVGEKENAVSHI